VPVLVAASTQNADPELPPTAIQYRVPDERTGFAVKDTTVTGGVGVLSKEESATVPRVVIKEPGHEGVLNPPQVVLSPNRDTVTLPPSDGFPTSITNSRFESSPEAAPVENELKMVVATTEFGAPAVALVLS
jgi:hypothetical protein